MSEILYDKSAGNTVGYCDFRENRLRKGRTTLRVQMKLRLRLYPYPNYILKVRGVLISP
jgi:hypothetical protein